MRSEKIVTHMELLKVDIAEHCTYWRRGLHEKLSPKTWRCRAKFMSCEIHDYDRSARAHTMRMIDIGSEISQLHNNSTCVSCFAGNLCSFLKSCDFNFELSIN